MIRCAGTTIAISLVRSPSPTNYYLDCYCSSSYLYMYKKNNTYYIAGLGMFAGTALREGQLIGRVGDAAFPTVDQDWHVTPTESHSSPLSKHDGDYHWPLTNYDWMASDIGMTNEAEDVSATVTGFGAAPNCHFRLLNVHEHKASFDYFVPVTCRCIELRAYDMLV